MGLGYQHQDGIIGGEAAPTDFNRFTFRLNSDHVLWKSDKGFDVIKVGENLYYQHKASQGVDNGNQYSNPLSDALRAAPIVPIYNKDGGYFQKSDFESTGLFNYNGYLTNPYYALMNSSSGNNESRSYGLNLVGYLEIQPIKGLVYRGQVSYNQSSWSWRNFLPVYEINGQGAFNTTAKGTNSLGLGWGWNTTNTLTYRFDIGKHNFDIMAGTEYGFSKPNYGLSMSATSSDPTGAADLTHSYMDLFANHTSANVTGSGYGNSKGMSYFGRLNYNFAEKYMFSAIFRADGSSVFAPGHRWGYFPSFSAGWVVTNEKFMEKTESWLDFLKLRAGWGQNGNKNISAFQYEAAFASNAYSNYSFGTGIDHYTTPVTGSALMRLANEDLTWETSEQLDLGFDARFLAGHLSLNFDWYKKTTKDLLLYVPVSPTTGFDSALKNAGTVQNTGVELALNYNNRIGKDFNYNIGYNVSYNKNKVTKINSSQKYNSGGANLLSQGTSYMARFEEGQPIGYFWGYKTDGVIQNTEELAAYTATLLNGNASNSLQGSGLKVGDLKFVDYNGDGIINDEDKTNLGKPMPDVTMGLNLGFNYKGFDFALTGYASIGNQVARSYRRFADSGQDNFTTEVYSYWNGEGTSDKFPQLALMNTGANWQQISDIYIENASYFRLQNVTVGYDVARLLSKNSPFEQLRVYFAAQNLLTLTPYKGMDPENGNTGLAEKWISGVDVGNYPQPRTFMVGVNVKFAHKGKTKAQPTYYQPTEPQIVEREVIKEVPVEKVVYKEAPKKAFNGEDNIYFVINKTDLRPGEAFKLGRLCEMLIENPDTKISIAGYADKQTGNESINTRLSRERAQVVADTLIKAGISPSRITTSSAIADDRVAVCIVK